MALLLLALLALPAAKTDVYLTVSADGPWLKTRVTNGGSAPVELYLGRTCGGADPFEMVVDGKAQPFGPNPGPCDKDEPVLRTLAPAGSYDVPPQSLDGKAHDVVVRYKPRARPERTWVGSVSAAKLHTHTGWSIRLTVRTDGQGHPEIVHTNVGSETVTVLAKMSCGGAMQDVLLVDRAAKRLGEMDPECRLNRAEWVELPPGKAFVSTAAWTLPPGPHTVVAQYEGQCLVPGGIAADCAFATLPLPLTAP